MKTVKLRPIVSVFFGLVILVSLLSAKQPTVLAEESSFPEYSSPIDLINPLNSSPTIYDGAVGKEGNHDVLYTTSKGVPAMLNVIDLDDNKLLRSLPLEGAADSWQHEVAPDGTVYIAAGKYLWGYSPVTKQVQALATIPESSLWALAVDENSNAYIGTYPNGKVFQYNVATKKLRDYGKMIGDISQEYVRSMDYHNGYVYAGTAHKKIMKLNVETGEKVDISGELNETGFVYDLDIVDNRYLFARYSESKNMYVYDLNEEKWLDIKLTNVNGLHVTDSLDGKVYFVADQELKYLDLETLKVGETAMTYGSGLRGADWVEIEGNSKLPGKSLVTVTFDGKVNFFNIETQKIVTYDSVVPPTANVMNKLYSYSKDKIYISGMTGATGAVYNPETGENHPISLGQADSIYRYQDKTYFGVYPDGSVQMIDTNQNPYATPTKLFVVGNEQDRLHTMTDGDGKLFIGSIATYGKLGGALTVIDGETHKVFRNIVQDQSIIGLAYENGKLYGSTTINGGLGSTPTADEAKLFVWDPVAEKKIKETSLNIDGLEKPEHIGELKVGPKDGYIWGASKGFIFALDPETLNVVKSVEIDSNPAMDVWNAIHLEWSKNGLLYADIGNSLYVINPETLEHKFITNTVSFTLGEDGDIYFSRLDNRTVLAKIEVMDEGEYVWDSKEVVNTSFEKEMNGWTSMFQTGADYNYDITTEKSHTGEKSLKIHDSSQVQSVAIYSDPIPVIPGKEYKGNVWMYIENGSPSLLVRMYDQSGKQLKEEYVQVKSGYDKWQLVEQKITAPENASYARLFALSTSYATTDCFFDDFAFYERVKATDILKSVELTVPKTSLTRGEQTDISLTGIRGDGQEISLVPDELKSSNEKVMEVVDNQLIAKGPGKATIIAKVLWKGKQYTSNSIEFNVIVTLESFGKQLEKLNQEKIISHDLYMRISNHLRQAIHQKEKGNREQVKQHLNVMNQLIEKENMTEHEQDKQNMIDDIAYLIHFFS